MFWSKVLPLVRSELDPGDAMFFHCNLLHCSDQNNSDHRRWAFLISYNRVSNNPVIKHHHPMYTPLIKASIFRVTIKFDEIIIYQVPDLAILKCKTVVDLSGKDFMDPKNDHTVTAIEQKDLT